MKKALAYSQKYMYNTVDRKPHLFLLGNNTSQHTLFFPKYIIEFFYVLLLAGTNSLKFAEVPTFIIVIPGVHKDPTNSW